MSVELLEQLVPVTTGIVEASNRTDLLAALSSGCTALGFDIFTLSCHRPRGPELICSPTVTNAPESFLSDYRRQNWFDGDMSAARLLAGDGPFFWDGELDGQTLHRRESYLDFLRDLKMRSGLMIPLPNRPGTASAMGFISFTSRRFGQDIARAGRIIATMAMTKAESLGLCSGATVDQAMAVRSLSRPQSEILKWISEGKSNLDIATIMGLNERAVRYHVTEILRKFGVATRAQAASMFISSDPRKQSA